MLNRMVKINRSISMLGADFGLILEFILTNKRVEAIKMVKDAANCNLFEAKLFVDGLIHEIERSGPWRCNPLWK